MENGANKLSTFQRYLALFIVSAAAALIYKVAYLREVFYEPLMQGLDVTNTEIGYLSGVYGTVCMLLYIPGGIIADKFSPKNLLIFSLGLAGGLSLWYATIPSYYEVVAIMGLMGVATTLGFWSAFLKAVNILGGEKEQGKFYGYSEAMRAVIGMGVSFAALACIEIASSAMEGLQMTLAFYGVIYLALAVLTFFFLPTIEAEKDDSIQTSDSALSLDSFKAALKMPSVWLVTLLIFALYNVYALQSYTTPFMGTLGISTSMIGIVGIIRQYGIGLFASPMGGLWADKIGSSAKTVMGASIVMSICIIGLLVAPASMSQYVFIALIVSTAFMLYVARGVQWATMKESKIPTAIVGSATGIISVIAYLPDLYIYAQVGSWLDNYPAEQAYNMIWYYLLFNAVLAIIACFGIVRLVAKQDKKVNESALQTA